jgi:osmoprotectant transport system substrate-binding protein
MRTRFRTGAVGAVVVALALVASACGDDGPGDGTIEGPAIRIGSTDFGEQVILGEIYAQVLEANGYRVERRLGLGTRETVNPALKSDAIDMMAEYTGSLLTYEGGTPSSSSEQTFADLVALLEPQGLTASAYAPAQNKNGLVVTAETAATLGLTTVSDLVPHSGTLVLGGPPECPVRELCLPGYAEVYGLEFSDFRPLDAGGPITVAALDGGEIDVALLFTSDGVIAARGFVLLDDDRDLQPAENIVPVMRQALVDAYGQDLVDLLDRVSSALTTADLAELNKRYGIDAVDADVLARDWLEANGFL